MGLNILDQFVQDRGALLNWIADAEPPAVVVMDGQNTAQSIRVVSPSTTVIHRAYNPNDHRWHEVISPLDWLNGHAGLAVGGVVLQTLNEPHGYTDLRSLARWSAELMALAAAQNIRLCLPNWGVGHPDSNRIIAGELDELFRAFDRFPMHLYGVHEYAQQSAVDERPYRIGRFLDSFHRMDALGLKRPRVIATEAGRDVGGGRSDGWRGAGWSEPQYVQFLNGYRDLYRAYNISACIFCYGNGADGQWSSFNVEGAGTVLRALIDWNQEVVSGDDMVFVRKPLVTYALNMRASPMVGNNLVSSVGPNQPVRLLEANVSNGWIKINNEGVAGYVSLQTNLAFEQQVKVTAA